MLRDSGRKVIALVEQAASAATVVARAASEVTLVEDGEFMIHDPFIKPSSFAGYSRIAVADLQLAAGQLMKLASFFWTLY